MTRRQALHRLAGFLAGSPLLDAQYASRADHQRTPGLDELASALEFEPIAHAKMTQLNYDYVAGGVEDEVALRRNRKAFDWITLQPRPLAAVTKVDLTTTILGQPMASPLLVAPTGGQQGVHSEGDVEMHRGASAARTTMCVSHVATFPLADIAAAATGPLWSQLYVHLNPTAARERIDQAGEVGCKAIVWTVDAQYTSLRERLRHGANLGERTAQGAQAQVAARRRSRARGGRPSNPYGLNPETPDLTWDFLETLRSWTPLPIVVKGLLTAEDARLAVDSGADAVVVSNHGARYMPHVAATIETLEEIVDEVDGKIPVLVDGGFRRGSDVLKALALGADGVLLGRAALWGLGAFGAAGVQRVLEILQTELTLAMAQCGVASVAEIDRSLVRTDFP